MTLREELQATRDFIHKNGWTQRAIARDKNGKSINMSSPNACSFCLGGAMIKIGADEAYRFLTQLLSKRGSTIPHFNDEPGRTKEDILNFLDAMIADS